MGNEMRRFFEFGSNLIISQFDCVVHQRQLKSTSNPIIRGGDDHADESTQSQVSSHSEIIMLWSLRILKKDTKSNFPLNMTKLLY